MHLAALRSRSRPSRLCLEFRDAIHESLRIARHDGERDGGCVVAEAAARRVVSIAGGVSAPALLQALQERRHRWRDTAKALSAISAMTVFFLILIASQ